MYTDSELEKMGIRRTTAPGRGRAEAPAYIYKCATCGNEVLKRCIVLSSPIYCKMCVNDVRKKLAVVDRRVQQEARELERLMGIDYVHEDRFHNATQAVKSLGIPQQIITDASAFSQKYGSVPEAIAAIVLLSCGVKIIPQAKIFGDAKMAVDFLLPDHKVCIEVDGELYHRSEEKREIRDYVIQHRLGSDWEVIHIPAEAIKEKVKSFRQLIARRFRNKSA